MATTDATDAWCGRVTRMDDGGWRGISAIAEGGQEKQKVEICFFHWIFEFCLKGVKKQKDIEIYVKYTKNCLYSQRPKAITPKSTKNKLLVEGGEVYKIPYGNSQSENPEQKHGSFWNFPALFKKLLGFQPTAVQRWRAVLSGHQVSPKESLNVHPWRLTFCT